MSKVSIVLPYFNRKNLLYNTLESFSKFYRDENIEVVIVDDGSSEDQRLEQMVKKYPFDINLIRIEGNNDVNPCYVYNVGVRHSVGDIIVLSSPETFHTSNMFKVTNNFKELNDKTYLLLSVFCLTDPTLKLIMEDMNVDFDTKLNHIEGCRNAFYLNLGCHGYPFNNDYGSWYLHSIYRKSGLNFFSVLSRNLYNKISGFDERFRKGTGCDDEEFRVRVFEEVDDIFYYDESVAIHVDHALVREGNPISNSNLFKQTRKDKYQHNDKWGIIT